jgi:hypothetical protein
MLKRKFSTSANAKSRGYMIITLYTRRTEIGTRDSLDKAIKTTASPEKTKYIADN